MSALDKVMRFPGDFAGLTEWYNICHDALYLTPKFFGRLWLGNLVQDDH